VSRPRLIYVVEYPFGARDQQRFGLDILRKEGIDVEVWELAPFIHPSFYRRHTPPDPIEVESRRVFHSRREAISALELLPRTTWLMLILNLGPRQLPIFRAVRRLGLRNGFLSTNSNEILPATKRGLAGRLLRNPALVVHALFSRIPARRWKLGPATFAVAGGEASLSPNHFLVGPATHILRSHTLDYDNYLAAASSARVHPGRYAVFLDQYWPFHPDFVIEKRPLPIAPENYYPRLVRLFEKVESELGLEVVIAAHPRGSYDWPRDYFGGRSLVKGKTIELTRDAELVLLHFTTAVNYAVLYRKPVMFVQIDPTEYGEQFTYVDAIAGALGKQPVELDHLERIDWLRELTVDGAAYERYRNRHIKADGSSELPCWSQIAEFIHAQDTNLA
jgi:hypothetical protein